MNSEHRILTIHGVKSLIKSQLHLKYNVWGFFFPLVFYQFPYLPYLTGVHDTGAVSSAFFTAWCVERRGLLWADIVGDTWTAAQQQLWLWAPAVFGHGEKNRWGWLRGHQLLLGRTRLIILLPRRSAAQQSLHNAKSMREETWQPFSTHCSACRTVNFVDRRHNEHEYKHAIHLLIDETHIFSVTVVTLLCKKIQVQKSTQIKNMCSVVECRSWCLLSFGQHWVYAPVEKGA